MRLALIAALLLTGAGSAAHAQIAPCDAASCELRLTPAQLLASAERLVALRRFDEARPLIEALKLAPGYKLQIRFLTGLIAAESGDFHAAANQYKAILTDDPNQTRVRLELAKAMMAMGKPQSADKQFRLAGQDRELPPELAKAIRGVRAVIRQQRAWRLDVDFGIAPDSNINNATAVDQVTVNLGGYQLPLELNDAAKARSGTGQTATISAGLRLPVAANLSMLVDMDGNGSNYAGSDYDDYLVQFAAGPELRLSQTASVSAEAVGAQRWYGGRLITRQAGVKAGAQTVLGSSDRVGVQLDARRTDALFDSGYSGWQAGLYGTFEHALSRSLIASVGIFGRRDWLDEAAWSNKEAGASLAIGGELPHGINFSLSGTASRAIYDAPIQFFSNDVRRDWRWSTRATLGNRSIRVFGFSPELSLAYARTDSNIAFYSTDRLRFRFALARYF
ncbi:surface lipoprotein assembly modifier [Sphingomonas psychrotolerans]|uniref:Surface lipoprotein assembly modifier n=1 Tax=Sphingomonas psychrotolerans TaxID=1327635 RepID=A0ABU3MYW4_9SPHN|nr:surface lipoprotein assembly modifier [Sphingomonas psychrotolerans]MDT8757498.1 surface lipoprotein assembly modifier [Sphingomonas psychrotolerans]